MCLVCLSDTVYFVRPQYSQKEDKYEEEIKVLTDKLKEVSELAWLIGISHAEYTVQVSTRELSLL